MHGLQTAWRRYVSVDCVICRIVDRVHRFFCHLLYLGAIKDGVHWSHQVWDWMVLSACWLTDVWNHLRKNLLGNCRWSSLCYFYGSTVDSGNGVYLQKRIKMKMNSNRDLPWPRNCLHTHCGVALDLWGWGLKENFDSWITTTFIFPSSKIIHI